MDRQLKANLTYRPVPIIAQSKGLPVDFLWQGIGEQFLLAVRSTDCPDKSACQSACMLCRACMLTTGLWVDKWIQCARSGPSTKQENDGVWQGRVLEHAAFLVLDGDILATDESTAWDALEIIQMHPTGLAPLPSSRPSASDQSTRTKRHDYSATASTRDMGGLVAKEARRERHHFEATTSLLIKCAWAKKDITSGSKDGFVYWCIQYGYNPVSWERVRRPQCPDDYRILLERYQEHCPTSFGAIHWTPQMLPLIQFQARLLNRSAKGELLKLLESGEDIDGIPSVEARVLAQDLRRKWLKDVRDDNTDRDKAIRRTYETSLLTAHLGVRARPR